MPSFSIENYGVYQVSGRNSRRAFIPLYDNENNSVAILNFYSLERESLPANTQARDGRYSLNYHYSEFLPMMDMLRNESPIQCFVSASGSNIYGDVLAIKEPVGEDEIRELLEDI